MHYKVCYHVTVAMVTADVVAMVVSKVDIAWCSLSMHNDFWEWLRVMAIGHWFSISITSNDGENFVTDYAAGKQ